MALKNPTHYRYLLAFVGSLLIPLLHASNTAQQVVLSHGIDTSAGGDSTYIIYTPNATYYLEKSGGGLSSLLDKDGIDWLGFHKREGSGWKGEYRGFPNAIHKQDGSYFHAMNAKTAPSTSQVTQQQDQHLQIVFTSGNKQWQGTWDFYPSHCNFTMSKVSKGYHYWVLYEGVPNGEIDSQDFWYASIDKHKHSIHQTFAQDLPAPEWIAFGDQASPRMLSLLQHEDDTHPDEYGLRPYMTVFGFGRSNKDKFIDKPHTFSIGFIESTDYETVKQDVLSRLAQP